MNEDKLMSEVLKYNGKMLKKEGTRKDKEDKQINWKLWHILFDTGRLFPWKCSIFANHDAEDKPIPGKGVHVSDMKEGNFYEVVYKNTEYQHDVHGVVKSKQAVLIKEAKEVDSTQDLLGKNNNNADPVSSTQTIIKVADGWVEFAHGYNEAVKNGGDPMHMLAAYVANKCATEFENIIALCKKNFNK